MPDLHYPTASPAMVNDIMDKLLVLSLDDYNDTVRVIVGSGKRQVQVECAAKVLGLQSEFFRVKAEFDSFLPHANHQRPVIDLSEQNVDAMSMFFVWNTTGNIYSAKRLSTITVPSDGTKTTKELDGYRILWDQLLECYFLADYLGAPNFGNAIIDALFKAINDEADDRARLEVKPEEKDFVHSLAPTPEVNNGNDDNDDEDDDNETVDDDDDQERGGLSDPFEERVPQKEIRQMLGTLPYQIQRMYSKTKKGSPLRKMLVDKIINQAITIDLYEKLQCIVAEGVPIEFHRTLVDELMRTAVIVVHCDQGGPYRRRADERSRDNYLYHIHKVGERCI
ncbi:hypothetical protein SBOR_6484 [Sclerotinia borealis F-4128]|uniref:BTB domain-containing protein n=1 Tax=Sclerotinia borealis (strain F-4128) TaxID=1432307 RepID=W9C8N1_SCLBF|nr:hypothetical protein SBOR_6484 [Sclerotinia borealis F-4128]